MKYDIIIVGGGIIGLAIGYKLLEKAQNLKICILEKENDIAQHQSGNNSGVIHSGIYYSPNSKKAINCKRGYEMLLNFCNEENIPYDLCGKVIVAVKKEEIPILENLYSRGLQNGLSGTTFLNESELKDKEPFVNGIKGIWVPQTGIIDYKMVALKYAEKIIAKGGEIKLNHIVIGLKLRTKEARVLTSKGDFSSNIIINCAGLYSDKIARMTGQGRELKIIPFRGEYYNLRPEKSHLVNSLIYPVPNPTFPFLGVHFTKKINGIVEAGPNAVIAFKREGYKNTQINFKEMAEYLIYPGFIKIATKYWKDGIFEMYRSYSKRAFVKTLQNLIPSIESKDIIKGGAGVRAQACTKDGKLVDDFLILEQERVINVCNAPSPAATSSLSIGETISKLIFSKLNLKWN